MTLLEALNKLPEQYREAAIRNATKSNFRALYLEVINYGRDEEDKNAVARALNNGFGWYETNEGVTYWCDLYEKINFENYNV